MAQQRVPAGACGSLLDFCRMKLFRNVSSYAKMVRLSHTIFGLPFTLASALFAHQFDVARGGDGLTWLRLTLIVVAFTAARTAAMGFNRIVDRRIDAKNPRTAQREIPAGTISLAAAWTMTLLSTAAFVGAAAALGRLTLLLSPLCLVVIFGYSLFKRFSWLAHLVLGLALSLAPGGAWVAVTGDLTGWEVPTLLMGAVATWVAGFDVLYSLQDRDFDRSQGLHSIPVRFGVVGSLVISGLAHLATVGLLVAVHLVAGLGPFHAAGVALIAVILAYEHWIVRPSDLSRIDKAFFDLNGYVSLAYAAAVIAGFFLG